MDGAMRQAQADALRQRPEGAVYLDYLTWDGEPDVLLGRPPAGGTMWRRAWVEAVDQFRSTEALPYDLVQNRGTGLLMQGTRQWVDYRATATLATDLSAAAGIAVRVQGQRRYYALLLCAGGLVRLVKVLGQERILAEAHSGWQWGQSCLLSLEARGDNLRAWVDGALLFDVRDDDRTLLGGAVALVCREGALSAGPLRVQPLQAQPPTTPNPAQGQS